MSPLHGFIAPWIQRRYPLKAEGISKGQVTALPAVLVIIHRYVRIYNLL